MTVDVLLLIPIALTLLWIADRARTELPDRAVSLVSRSLRGWQPDEWPVGVQEEDRDGPWGRAPSRRAQTDRAALPPPKPTLVRVRAVVRGR